MRGIRRRLRGVVALGVVGLAWAFPASASAQYWDASSYFSPNEYYYELQSYAPFWHWIWLQRTNCNLKIDLRTLAGTWSQYSIPGGCTENDIQLAYWRQDWVGSRAMNKGSGTYWANVRIDANL
ncbi:MAG: hypothetical protein M3304_08845 [Actinomycetota bacterium]|nr:hypothetical protein [Actinomycetota bacterium]